MRRLKSLFGWILGTAILCFGLFISIGSVFAGAPVILASLLVIPLSNYLLGFVTGQKITFKARISIISLLFIISFILVIIASYFVEQPA